MADAHFGVCSSNIYKYILENQLSAISPNDIAKALVFGEGVKKTGVDFIKTNRRCEKTTKWWEAKKEKFVSVFGRCG